MTKYPGVLQGNVPTLETNRNISLTHARFTKDAFGNTGSHLVDLGEGGLEIYKSDLQGW